MLTSFSKMNTNTSTKQYPQKLNRRSKQQKIEKLKPLAC